jgi:hypothetical protein
MMPGWYQRMSRRERMLAWIAAGAVFALLNLFILDWIFGGLASAQRQIATRRATLAEQALYVKERDLWTKRDQWIHQHQPTLKNPAEASTLLDQLKEIAGKYNILVENPAIGSGETTPYHQSVFASIETKSPWSPLVHFLYDVQRPDSFIVFENVNLAIDGNDPTMMSGTRMPTRFFHRSSTMTVTRRWSIIRRLRLRQQWRHLRQPRTLRKTFI